MKTITREQFALQIDRLIDVWGDKAFSEQREYLIWEAVDGLQYAQVIALVDGFIRSSRNAPLPQDFIAAASEFESKKLRYMLGEEKPIDEAACKDCLDSGFIRLTRRTEYAKWAVYSSGSAPCHCFRGKDLIAAGKRRKRPIDFGAQFNETWLASYDIERPYKPTFVHWEAAQSHNTPDDGGESA